ncbi:MAG: Crp/Fnr family transcriptional regulator [Acidimicrobiales bacterium]
MFGLRNASKTPISPQLLKAGKGAYNRHELALIQRLGTTIHIEAGSTFVTEGASGQEVLMILEGTAAVSRDGETIANVGPGDIVGEQSVLLEQPRNASLIATTPVVATVFTAREFRDLLHQSPRLDLQIKDLLAKRAIKN